MRRHDRSRAVYQHWGRRQDNVEKFQAYRQISVLVHSHRGVQLSLVAVVVIKGDQASMQYIVV